MIKNIVFDMGGVLLEFCWKEQFEKKGISGALLERVANATVRNKAWDEFDRGIMTFDEVVNLCISNDPEIEEEIRKVLTMFPDMIRKMPYTDELIDTLKAAGYKLYILSNFPQATYEHSPKVLDFISKTDGQIISYKHHVIKPDEEIYKLLLSKYNLNANESVFIDDKPENIEGAENCGIMGIQFTTIDDLMHRLRSMEIL